VGRGRAPPPVPESPQPVIEPPPPTPPKPVVKPPPKPVQHRPEKPQASLVPNRPTAPRRRRRPNRLRTDTGSGTRPIDRGQPGIPCALERLAREPQALSGLVRQRGPEKAVPSALAIDRGGRVLDFAGRAKPPATPISTPRRGDDAGCGAARHFGRHDPTPHRCLGDDPLQPRRVRRENALQGRVDDPARNEKSASQRDHLRGKGDRGCDRDAADIAPVAHDDLSRCLGHRDSRSRRNRYRRPRRSGFAVIRPRH